MLPVSSVAMTPALAVREKFTGKEFDVEGEDSANGVAGVRAYYFGARYFDPELGVWTSRDAAGQFFNPYGYAGNPVLMVDEDGNFFWMIPVIGFAFGFISGIQSGQNFGEALLSGVGGAAGATLIAGTAIAGVGLISGGAAAISAGGSALGVAAGIGQVAAGAALLLPTVQTGVSMVTGWANGESNVPYYLGGGLLTEYVGNALGDLNMLTGGKMDFYRGNWVYSEGIQARLPGSGGEYFGHATFIDKRGDRRTMAHEFTHTRQQVEAGSPLVFFTRYSKHSAPWEFNDEYYKNPYELEAYYNDFLYGNKNYGGQIDLYGKRKGDISPSTKQAFVNYYNQYRIKDPGQYITINDLPY